MISGVELKNLEVNADDRGHLVEIFREDWNVYDPEPKMSYYSLSYPGVIRAWHRHTRGQIDHFVCPSGRIKIGIYDDRPESETEGESNEFIIGEHNQKVVRIPGECWHGFKVVGNNEALLVNFPTKLYDYDDPDEERLPPNTDEIPFDWETKNH